MMPSMKKTRHLLSGFRAKVTSILILTLLFVTALSNYLVYKFALDSQFNELREILKVIAQTAAFSIDADLIQKVPLNREGVQSPQYKAIAEKLVKIKEANKPIRWIYTMAKTRREGTWQFVVDPEPVSKESRVKGVTAYPGDSYDASRFPEMLKAFDGPSSDRELSIDEWGITLSGYAPIRDRNGTAVAILAVDMMAEDVYKIQRDVHRRGMLVFLLGVIFSIALGIVASNRITKPVRQLVEGTRRVADGDLHHQVEVKGADEISELAHSFNEMAARLLESRKELHDYFYRVMQSLIRILEARDGYTRGHSERVAEHSKKIALAMGFSEERAELIERSAQLHDIGKLVVQKEILNKEGRLTDEEWKIIHDHPMVSEDILKPVVFDKEMLDIVRSHHERYDGIGYPDKMDGKSINIFAQVIAVADSYDAMTSARAYRPALSREDAIEELKKYSGTQFNPRVVDAFIAVLTQEPCA